MCSYGLWVGLAGLVSGCGSEAAVQEVLPCERSTACLGVEDLEFEWRLAKPDPSANCHSITCNSSVVFCADGRGFAAIKQDLGYPTRYVLMGEDRLQLDVLTEEEGEVIEILWFQIISDTELIDGVGRIWTLDDRELTVCR